ncbi:hypothetical protein [Amycolatopsis cihanbeyliensis]|uniref:Uncharacterized protein n=1 Tax=Amycolatopsis cihanbeyliensis TaxID=1128664 RepID=A0A542DCQ5_AMYCI|nr:hypothetical protein [Amycolatopsis cihanbeyliensis]TQJ00844.1 hypothetical protein FB471_0495 [Amycolatopsis cihanbeyliensis]
MHCRVGPRTGEAVGEPVTETATVQVDRWRRLAARAAEQRAESTLAWRAATG